MKTPPGVVAVFVDDGRVIASASEFDDSRYSSFSLLDTQRIRAKDKLVRAVITAYCSPVVWKSLHVYDCEQVIKRLPGEMHFIPIGHGEEGE